MAKKQLMEEVEKLDFELDGLNEELPLQEVQIEEPKHTKQSFNTTNESLNSDRVIPNCLRNERIIVRHVPKESGMISNPKHILYGGMAEGAVRVFTVPRLTSGMFVNVLTDDEKSYLENLMGLEYNALSVYKKVDNYWENYSVRLTKQDNMFNLADPDDYIRYKVLLANKNFIAPSLKVLQDSPKATYQFVIIVEGEENKSARDSMSATMKAYKEFGKIEDDADLLRVIIETIDGRPTAATSKLEFLQTKINNLIQADSKLFLRVVTDPLLNTKVLIKRSIEAGLIAKRGDFLYLREDNSPLCESNEEPTLNIAAKYLSHPKRQSIKFSLEAKLNQD